MVKVSAIVAAYNHGRFIYQAIQSLATQVDEVIALDDASSDNSWENITRTASEFNNVIALRNSENLGISATYNKGVANSTGDILLFQGGDDISLPWRRVAQELTLSNREISLSFSNAHIISELGLLLSSEEAPELLDKVRPKDIFQRLLKEGNFICGATVAMRREDFLISNGFSPSLQHLQDYFMWLKLARIGNFYQEEVPVAMYRKHAGNISAAVTQIDSRTKALETELAAIRSFFERKPSSF